MRIKKGVLAAERTSLLGSSRKEYPAPILLALLLNEIRNSLFQKVIQAVTYLPHFISMVVVCGILLDFLARDGMVNHLIGFMYLGPIPFMLRPEWFWTVFVASV